MPGVASCLVLPALVLARFAWVQATLARAAAPGTVFQTLAFLAVSLALTIGPGLFLWRTARLSTDNAALFLTHVLATSLGCAMLAPWLLLLCGLWTRGTAIAFVLACAALGLVAVGSYVATPAARASTRRGIAHALCSLTISEALSIGLALAVGELLFELVAGTPMRGWDAFLSWDRWAEELAAGHSLGRRAFGFYPQGIPLIGSIFYKVLPAAGPIPATTAHLLLHGFHAVFPLLLLLSVCALARPIGFNPLVGQSLVLSDFFLVQSLLKQVGDADVPLTAFCAATLALALFAAASAQRPAPRFAVAAATVPTVFALVFTKGSGLAMAPVLWLALRHAADKPTRRRILATLALGVAPALPFYLHQAALALFPSLALHDPFHLALPLETAHTDLFNPGLAHLSDWILKTGPNLCLGNGPALSWTAAALAAAAVLAALAIRKSRAMAFGAVFLFVLWFFTASYDWRNAFPAHLLACLAAAATVESLANLPRRTAVRSALAVLAVFAALALLSRQRLPSLAADRLAHRPVRPPLLSLPGVERISRISPMGDAFALFRAVPFLRDAPHLRMPGRDYRLLPNAVRGIPYKGADAFADPREGDLCFARRSFFAATRDYQPVATLHGPRDLGDTLLLFRPKPVEGEFRGNRTSAETWEFTLDAPHPPRAGFLELEFRPDKYPDGIPDGFAITCIRPDDQSPENAVLAAQFDALFRPIVLKNRRDGRGPVIRCPFWFPENSSTLPSFRLSAKTPLPSAPMLDLLH